MPNDGARTEQLEFHFSALLPAAAPPLVIVARVFLLLQLLNFFWALVSVVPLQAKQKIILDHPRSSIVFPQ
jgi:hypothetical protein